ncbi:MAG: hypothetical protein NTX61_00365 [Bacteroidetes bacterium]|nr:hypothetical protein [Bacteroidota bacterium]
MNRPMIYLCILMILNALTGKSENPGLDEILQKYYNAIGIEKMKEWQTLTMTGKTLAMGSEYPIKLILKRPGKIRIEVEVQGVKMIQVFDGVHGWSVAPWSGSTDPQDMTADEIKVISEQADFEGPLYNWKEKGHKAELIGKEDMEGTSVYKIKLTKAKGDIDFYFIDAESFVVIKTTTIVKMQGNESEGDSYSSNYKEVNGVMMAFTIENKFKGQNGQMTNQLVIDKVNVDEPVNDNLFVKPVKK